MAYLGGMHIQYYVYASTDQLRSGRQTPDEVGIASQKERCGRYLLGRYGHMYTEIAQEYWRVRSSSWFHDASFTSRGNVDLQKLLLPGATNGWQSAPALLQWTISLMIQLARKVATSQLSFPLWSSQFKVARSTDWDTIVHVYSELL